MLKKIQPEVGPGVTEALVQGFHALGLDLLPEQSQSLHSHLTLLINWNRKINLTSINNPISIVKRHILDSVAIVRFLSPAGRLLDVGSGAGFPGIPIKVTLPEKELFVVESQRKKANFLREVIRQLNLHNSRVIEERFEKILPPQVGHCDEIVARAFGSTETFLKHAFHLLAPGGRTIIMHGPKGREVFPSLQYEAAKVGFTESRLEPYSLPMGSEKRSALIFLR